MTLIFIILTLLALSWLYAWLQHDDFEVTQIINCNDGKTIIGGTYRGEYLRFKGRGDDWHNLDDGMRAPIALVPILRQLGGSC